MINQIRADFYRQRHSIGMLLLLIATVAPRHRDHLEQDHCGHQHGRGRIRS